VCAEANVSMVDTSILDPHNPHLVAYRDNIKRSESRHVKVWYATAYWSSNAQRKRSINLEYKTGGYPTHHKVCKMDEYS